MFCKDKVERKFSLRTKTLVKNRKSSAYSVQFAFSFPFNQIMLEFKNKRGDCIWNPEESAPLQKGKERLEFDGNPGNAVLSG